MKDADTMLRSLLIVLLCAPLAIPTFASDALETVYAEFAEQAVGWYDPPSGLGLGPDPRAVLGRALQDGGPTRQAGIARLAEEYDLPRPAAEALFEATLHAWKALDEPYSTDVEIHHRKAAGAAYERVYGLAPDHPEAVLSLAAYHDERALHAPESLDRLLALATGRAVDDPLWSGLEFRTGFNGRAEVVRQALDREPGNPLWLESLAQSSLFGYRHGARAAIYGALRGLGSVEDSPLPDQARWLREEIAALLDTGLWQLALDRLEAAPEAVREGLLAAPVGRAAPPVRHVRRDLDVRLRLAMAEALAGRVEQADALLARIPSADAWLFDSGAMGSEIETKAREVLAALGRDATEASSADPGNEDPYDLLLRVVGVGTYDPPQDGVVVAVAAKVAEEAGYRAIARYLAHRAQLLRGMGLDPMADDRLPEVVLTTLESLRREQSRDSEGLAAQLARLDDAPATMTAYREPAGPIDWGTRLPDWARPRNEQAIESTGSAEDLDHRGFQAMLGLGDSAPAYSNRGLGRRALPRGFQPVTQGGTGDRRGAVVLGHALGHRFGHGYWWVESDDGGETWSEPVFTGLLIRRPYQLIPDTWLRPQKDGRWRLGAELWNRIEDGRWLREGVAELVLDPEIFRADGDGDGLTDLVESRLGLDPTDADSDADGLDDGVDPVPQAALTGGGDPEAEAVALALETALEQVRTTDSDDFPSRRPVVLAAGLLDTGRLGAFDPTEPVFFLDPEHHRHRPRREVDRWVPLTVELFELDHEGRRGVLLTTRSGGSSQFLLERGEAGWTIEPLAGAIHCGISWGDP